MEGRDPGRALRPLRALARRPAIVAVERGFKASSGAVKWYRSRCGTELENSEIASPVLESSIKDLFGLTLPC